MKKYNILKPIILSFLTPQDQFDMTIAPEDDVTLESEDHTIWAVKNDERQKSITVAIAIQNWLDQGAIVEIQPG